MKIAVLGAGHIGSTVGRLWHAAGHEVIFAARDSAAPQAASVRRSVVSTRPRSRRCNRRTSRGSKPTPG